MVTMRLFTEMTGPIGSRLAKQFVVELVSLDGFGYSLCLSLDGKTLVIGGPWNGSNGVGSGVEAISKRSKGNMDPSGPIGCLGVAAK